MPTFIAADWRALCEFLEQQRQHYCSTRLMPERFKPMVAPETLEQRRAIGVVRYRNFAGHGSGWTTVDGWQARLALMESK